MLPLFKGGHTLEVRVIKRCPRLSRCHSSHPPVGIVVPHPLSILGSTDVVLFVDALLDDLSKGDASVVGLLLKLFLLLFALESKVEVDVYLRAMVCLSWLPHHAPPLISSDRLLMLFMIPMMESGSGSAAWGLMFCSARALAH